MRVRGVDFVGVCVPEGRMAEAMAFYGGVLGLPRGEIVNETWAEYQAGQLTIALDSAPMLAPPWDRPPGGEVWVALAVSDVEGAVSELRLKGVEVIEEAADCGVCIQAVLRDPFGNVVSLHQRKDGTAG